MGIAYYITEHGRGHAARALRILRALSPGVHVHLRSGVPRAFFATRLARPFAWSHVVADTGPLHTAAGSVDFDATIPRFEGIERDNAERFDAETAFLRDSGMEAVVCDIPPWPLDVAAAAGIPGIATVNFTWVEILEPAAARNPAAAALVERLRSGYSRATLALRTPPALDMPYFPRAVDVPLITVRGTGRRAELAARFGIEPRRPWAYLYFGEFGIDWLDPQAVEALHPWAFLTRHRPRTPLPGVVTVDESVCPHEDLTASVDVVVAKPGYGIVTECLGNGTPMVTAGREDFAEYRALEAALKAWGGAVILAPEEMLAGMWGHALSEAAGLRQPPSAGNGAEVCADIIERSARGDLP